MTVNLHPPVGQSSAWLRIALVGVLLPMIAILVGVLSASANPLLIAPIVGGILGAGLMMRPKVAFWIGVVGALLVAGPLVQFQPPEMARSSWLFAAVNLMLLGYSVLLILVRRDTLNLQPPAYAALVLLGYALVITLWLSPTIGPVFAGFKRYYQSIGIMFALAVLPFTFDDIVKLRRVLIIAVFAQLPFAIYQLLVWVPARRGMGFGVVPIDAVSGTFEANFYGGGSSSVMAFLLVMAAAYLVKRWLSGGLKTSRFLLYLPIACAPLAMGETKIVVVILPVAILLALRLELMERPFRGALIIGFTGAATVLLGYVYLLIMTPHGQSLWRGVEGAIAYNFGDAPYAAGRIMLNRTTALTFWWDQQSWSDPLAAAFGYGLGASYDGEGSLVPGYLARRYPNMGIGLTTATTVLWDLGAVGFTLLTLVFVLSWRCVRKAVQRHRGTRFGAMLCVVEAGIVVDFILLFYSDASVSRPSQGAIEALLFGLAMLGCRLPRQELPAAASPPRGHVELARPAVRP
ncbi:hypothetical protein [Caldimonas sp. KR1-144]|uniref:hypothetical protein n=1 Tax=Caldimonas sp. KR1-144 TaxID=3400911 RepID=UPI003C0B54AD